MRYILNISHIVLFLGGCAIQPEKIEPVVVKVPVTVSCMTAIAEPDWNIPHLRAGATPVEKLKSALADLELSRGYAGELKAELAACG